MNVKRNRTWLLFIACIILSIVFIFFSGVKNVTKSYGIVLLIFSILPIIPAILLTAKIKLPRIFTSGLTFIFYLLQMVSLGFNYYLQSWAGIVFIIILVIFFMLLGMLVALIRTLCSRKNGKYYFTDEEAIKHMNIPALVRLIKSNYLIPWSKDYGMHYFLQFLIGFKK